MTTLLGQAAQHARDARRLERENDQLRAELNEQRRASDRAADEREAERKQRLRDAMPSNRLYRGEITNAREAIEAHIAALEHEIAVEEREHPKTMRDGFFDDDEDRARFIQDHNKFISDFRSGVATAERALTEYNATIGKAELDLAQRWAASDDATTRAIGEAILANDYSRLAI